MSELRVNRVIQKLKSKTKSEFSWKYFVMCYILVGYMEAYRDDFTITNKTTANNFQENTINNQIMLDLFYYILDFYNYELSSNQIYIAICLFLNKQDSVS